MWDTGQHKIIFRRTLRRKLVYVFARRVCLVSLCCCGVTQEAVDTS